MNEHKDGQRSKLRAMVTGLDGEVAALLLQDTVDGYARTAQSVVARWTSLVELLALGPEPDVRECPYCQETVMKAATRCGYCWKRLVPPGSGPA